MSSEGSLIREEFRRICPSHYCVSYLNNAVVFAMVVVVSLLLLLQSNSVITTFLGRTNKCVDCHVMFVNFQNLMSDQ